MSRLAEYAAITAPMLPSHTGAASPDQSPASHRSGSPVPAALTWLGHSTLLLEIDGTRLLTDPVLGHRIGPLVRVAPGTAVPERIDGVLLSHLHPDHTDLRSLRRLDPCVPVIAPSPAGRWLRGHGVRDVRELASGEETMLGTVRVRATPARHDHRRHPLGPKADPVGFVVSGSRSVYFAGDTDLFAEMEQLRGSVDVALLPVAGWGPTLGPGHLDPERAAQAAALIAPSVAIPIHWGTFVLLHLARRPVDHQRPAREFAAAVARLAPAVEVRLLAPGERTEL